MPTSALATPIDREESKCDSNCKCESRRLDEEEKIRIQNEINLCYEDIIQLEQALIELDEQNTLNALEIRKREAKVFILSRQMEDMEESSAGQKENSGEFIVPTKFMNEAAFMKKHIAQHSE